MESLDVEILAGTLIMEANEIAIIPARSEVIVGNGPTVTFSPLATANLTL